MKVLHIGDNVLFGHRFNGHDLGIHLRNRGIESDHLVWWKNLNDSHTYEIAQNWQDRDVIRESYNKLNAAYGTNALFYPFSYDLLFNHKFLDCDVVHLHLIHNSFFGIEYLPIITRLKPVVWTIHDPWPFSGHCIYPLNCDRWQTGCGDCPDLNRSFNIRYDTSALNWEFKNLAIKASDLDIIVASKWMRDKICKSPIFENARVHLVNFGLDLNQFKPAENQNAIKQKFKIPPENIVIAFRSVNSIYKGTYYIKECLRMLTTTLPISLLIFNEKGQFNEFNKRFQIVELDWVDDDIEMIDAYNAADIFLMPSTAEAFGMMTMEAMACAKSVIVMDGTALPEVLKPEESGGIVIPQGDVQAMAMHLEQLIDNKSIRDYIGLQSRAVAEKHYNKNRYINEIIDVYQAAIDRKAGDARAQYIINQQKKIEFKKPDFTFNVDSTIHTFHQDVSEKEYQLITFLRRIKQIPFINYCYRNIAKPPLRYMRKIIRSLK